MVRFQPQVDITRFSQRPVSPTQVAPLMKRAYPTRHKWSAVVRPVHSRRNWASSAEYSGEAYLVDAIQVTRGWDQP